MTNAETYQDCMTRPMTWTFADVVTLQEYERLGLKPRWDEERQQLMVSGNIAPALAWLRERKQQVTELVRARSEIPW